MISRRILLTGFMVLPITKDFSLNKGKLIHEPSEAFRKLYEILTTVDEQFHKDYDLIGLAQKAGFSIIIGQVMISNDNYTYVIIKKDKITIQRFDKERKQIGKYEEYDSVDKAIEALYGIDKI